MPPNRLGVLLALHDFCDYPGSVKTFRLILSLAICIPLGALCGALYAFEASPLRGMIAGAFLGLVMGMAFGGVERVAEFIYGPKERDS
jgi:hypothetical protein